MNRRKINQSCVAVLAGAAGLAFGEPVCADSNAAVPDNSPSGLTLGLVIDEPGRTVDGVMVSLDIDHPWVGDLVVTVTSPDGTVVTLLDRPGIPDSGPASADFPGPFGCGGPGVLATFTDAALSPAETLCPLPGAVPGGPVIAGDLSPTQPLSAFAGEPASGTWTVMVSDASAYDTGVVRSVCLDVATSAACLADVAEPFGTLNFFDVSAYMGLYNAGDPSADLAEPVGVLNFFDVAAYIAAFNAGCP